MGKATTKLQTFDITDPKRVQKLQRTIEAVVGVPIRGTVTLEVNLETGHGSLYVVLEKEKSNNG